MANMTLKKSTSAAVAALLLVVGGCVGAEPSDDDDTADGAVDDDDAVDTTVDLDLDRDRVVAFLASGLTGFDPVVTEAAVAGLHLLEAPVPDVDDFLGNFDDAQRADGTWAGINEQDLHYAVFTMVFALMYQRLDRSPPRSLDAWIEGIDTWPEVEEEMRTFENPDNLWGGALGYVMLWIAERGTRPPWMDELDALAAAGEAEWILYNHQRPRVAQMLMAGGSEVPLQAEMLASILDQQNPDGGWGSEEDEVVSLVDDTTQTLTVLERLYAADPVARTAAFEGARFVATHYVEDGDYAGFAFEPGGDLDIDATFFALAAMVQMGVVDGDIGFRHAIGHGWSGL